MSLSDRPTEAQLYAAAFEKKERFAMRSQLLNSGQLPDLVVETLCATRCIDEGKTSCFNSEAAGEWKPCSCCANQAKAVINVLRSTL